MPERIDQDINFNLGDMVCIMQLQTTVPFFDNRCDQWMIKPHDPAYVTQEGARRFSLRIARAFEQLAGISEGVRVRTPRQHYSWQVRNEYANLLVSGRCYWSIANGIMLSLPDWDGQSLNFFSSHHLARLLADWRDADSDIQFMRSNGSVIEYEQYIEEGGNPLAHVLSNFWEMR